jgi:hypothetical protein
MKKPSFRVFMRKLIMALLLLLLHAATTAQPQWYQDQDGGMQPNGTYANAIMPFTGNSFIASYLWTIDNDQYTWKVSKTGFGGQEQKKIFFTGTTAMVDVKTGNSGTAYVLLRAYPAGQNPSYTVLKLNSNLQVVKQKSISFPGNYNIFNLGVFEVDESGNVYLGGDGQYENESGVNPASFLLKTDRNLVTKWSRMDSTETSYTGLHIDGSGKVVLIEDHYTTYPDVRISRFSSHGQLLLKKTVATDPGRLTLVSTLDKDDNLLLYGVKSESSGEQAVYLRKLSRHFYSSIYHRTLFTSPGIELNDLKVDGSSVFALVTRYNETGEPVCRISRIHGGSGHIAWNRSIPFSEDSCMLSRIVLGRQDRFYLVGQRLSQTYYAKGYAIRMKRNGDRETAYATPDSVAFQRTHVLLGGITDNDNRLIALGNTNDFDTLTYASSYFRAFTMRPGTTAAGGHGCDKPGTEAIVAEKSVPETMEPRASIYPNPASNELFVTQLQAEGSQWLVVYTMQGIPVIKVSTTGPTARLDISRLSAGTYVLRIQAGGGQAGQSLSFVIRR